MTKKVFSLSHGRGILFKDVPKLQKQIIMVYTENKQINSMKDVRDFFYYLVFEPKVNFHPDESFENYIDLVTQKPSFTSQECKFFNRLMNESFSVCERESEDIYEVGTDVMAF